METAEMLAMVGGHVDHELLFTTEVITKAGIITYYVLFFIHNELEKERGMEKHFPFQWKK